ncbi:MULTISPECIES: DUF6188 family protein [unclassified Gordonia (in: high G+C Gram-positive bacteria)]|uniref:DUF6188 family protein n=1 Tax=unclassified Gordonia (in: high G+C Gram-positive bacteria) TaxID=2657482 RepID=UPI0009ADD63C|nr:MULTISPECIES: DUF6188 family protein [unclassified Gordonia (in: high G+C Gram-positive bacteria)]MDF3281183.1 DUF6188 family protein [Gordonia sp. N1V]OPX16987.1 hypothetical protein B1964_01970 [Gordonia sp. i37]
MSVAVPLPLAGDKVIDIDGGYTIILRTNNDNFLTLEDPMVCVTNAGERFVVDPREGSPRVELLTPLMESPITSAAYTEEYQLTVLLDSGFSFFVEPNHDGYESWNARYGDHLIVAMWEPDLGNQ